jgi:hypothetical protein
MSKVVTPPDIVAEDTVYLVVNAKPIDVEMVVKWLKITNKKYTIHVYHDGMSDLTWLSDTAKIAQTILVNRTNTDMDTVGALLDHVAKLTWTGTNQEHDTVMDFLAKNG